MPTNVENVIRVIWVLLIRIVTIVASAYILYRVRSILISLLVAIVLTYALLPFVERLCKNCRSRRHQRTDRLIATIAVFVVFLVIVITLISFMVKPFQTQLATLSENMNAYGEKLQGIFTDAKTWYIKYVPPEVKTAIANMDYGVVTKSIASQLKVVLDATKNWVSSLMELVLIPVLAFYFVLDYRSLTREFYGLIPKKRRREAMRIGRDAGIIMQNYVKGQLILCIIAGVVTGIVLQLMGMPYVMVLALFAAVTRAIPAIGPVVSGVPIVLVGLFTFDAATAAWLLVFVIVMHFAESKFIMPLVIGDRLKLHPAMVIIVLLIGFEFFGLIGMFLAAPVAAITRELIRLYYINPRNKAAQAEQIMDATPNFQ
ncbi:MAG: AI-2E family transporter [Armatimonadetes bacterium]|nr:AI-2E family transporter [Armatimonadota bacterium]